MIQLTESAAGKVKELLVEEGRDDIALRVAVQPGGCSGLRYAMYLDDQVSDKDATEEQFGVQLVIDKMSVPYLTQATIDFVDSLEQSGFTIDNPAAQSSCACGNSLPRSGRPPDRPDGATDWRRGPRGTPRRAPSGRRRRSPAEATPRSRRPPAAARADPRVAARGADAPRAAPRRPRPRLGRKLDGRQHARPAADLLDQLVVGERRERVNERPSSSSARPHRSSRSMMSRFASAAAATAA